MSKRENLVVFSILLKKEADMKAFVGRLMGLGIGAGEINRDWHRGTLQFVCEEEKGRAVHSILRNGHMDVIGRLDAGLVPKECVDKLMYGLEE